MAYKIIMDVEVERFLKAKVKASEARVIMAAIIERLTHQPTVADRNRKRLRPEDGLFDEGEPLPWQLSIQEWRVWYDVDEKSKRVFVGHLFAKAPHKTTKDSKS